MITPVSRRMLWTPPIPRPSLCACGVLLWLLASCALRSPASREPSDADLDSEVGARDLGDGGGLGGGDVSGPWIDGGEGRDSGEQRDGSYTPRDALDASPEAGPVLSSSVTAAIISYYDRCRQSAHVYSPAYIAAIDPAYDPGPNGAAAVLAGLSALSGIAVDPEALARCEAALGAPCAPVDVAPSLEQSSVCLDLFRGTLPAGSPCVSRLQCAAGRCDKAIGSACGACAVACAGDSACGTEEGCIAGACVSLPSAGEVCTVDRRCRQGATCDLTGRCAPLGARGDRCALPDSCRLGLFCSFRTWTCEGRVAAGEACELAPKSCADGFGCARTGTSTLCLPMVETGAACAGAVCPPMDFCGGSPAICVPLGADGESCQAVPCRPELRCARGQCHPPRDLGERCDTSEECAPDPWSGRPVECLGSTCRLPHVGESCAGGGVCSDGRCVGALCAAPGTIGASCDIIRSSIDPTPGHECIRGAYCATDGRCRALPGEGEACHLLQCGPGLSCVAGEERCVTGPVIGNVAGDACTPEWSGSLSYPGATWIESPCGDPRQTALVCDGATARCAAPPIASLGEPCSISEDLATCLPDCDQPGVTALCRGGLSTTDCVFTADTGSRVGLCAARPRAGEPCIASVPPLCEQGSRCVSGRCELLAGEGQACERVPCADSTLVCLAGRCYARDRLPSCP